MKTRHRPAGTTSPKPVVGETVAPEIPARGAPPGLRILLVDDHPMVRRGVADMLTDEFPGATVGEAENAQQALERIWKSPWDVIILDVSLPGRSGLDLLKEFKQETPKTPVLVLSTHPEDQFAIRALRSGAASYLTKDVVPKELISAVRRILDGGKYIRPSLAEKLATHVNMDAEKPLHQALSNREFQVLCLIASGKTVKEIGAELSLSVKTISTYRCRILEKMLMKNNAELMRYVMQNDLARISGASPEP